MKTSTEMMPIVSSLIGMPYNENSFDGIVNALSRVSTESFQNLIKAENGLWGQTLTID